MTIDTTRNLVASFNVVARTEFTKNYKDFQPLFEKALLLKFNSGMVETVNFPIFPHTDTFEEFSGSTKYQSFKPSENFTIQNKEYANGLEIPIKDLQRAANRKNNSLGGLDPYKLRVGELGRQARNFPNELAFDLLEAGEGTTLGTSFDGQAFFSATHDYNTTGGTQDNLLTGSGTSLTNIKDDLFAAITSLNSFTYAQGDNETRRKLNSTKKIVVLAPLELHGIFQELKTSVLINGGESNAVKDLFDFETHPFADANDFYVIADDEAMFKPIFNSIEVPAEITNPTPTDESWRHNRIAQWSAYMRIGVAYGSWFKAVKVKNA